MKQRIPQLQPADACPDRLKLLDAVKAKMGSVPNIFTTFAHSPAALKGYLDLSGALAEGALDRRLREQIAVAVASYNNCAYCAAAHTHLGQSAGVTPSELSQNLTFASGDAKTGAMLTFVRLVLDRRGGVGDSDVDALREHGFTNEEIVEIVAHIGMNVLTNYFNRIADTEVDFPPVELATQRA